MGWRAIGFAKNIEVKNGLIKSETPFKDLSVEENKIVDDVLDYLQESYVDDYDSIMLHGNMDFCSPSAEIDTVIDNYKDDGEEVPEMFVKAFNLFEKFMDYSFLEVIKEVKD